jgi:uncharacterized flavoprotein (TIGR03862 family)
MINKTNPPLVAVIGAGPAGLIAAETLLANNLRVEIYDAKPSAGRKFLLAGKGGLNLTHSEAFSRFITRYGERSETLLPYLARFSPTDLRHWARELGFETFVGSSGRVFPAGMGAAKLLRTWLSRLRAEGATFHFRHRWQGWNQEGALRFATVGGEVLTKADGVVLALGGGSRPETGSDAAWIPLFAARGVEVTPLQPANCGFDLPWSEYFRSRFAGASVKTVSLSFGARKQRGEFVITEKGVEGSLIYAFSAVLREAINAHGSATFFLDLLPDWTEEKLLGALSVPRGSRSLASHLQKRTGLKGVKANLLWEVVPREKRYEPKALCAAIKALPLKATAARPLAEVISSAGGVSFAALDEHLMFKRMPGVFCAGEMLDWEAPTGGYLLTASFATGRAAGEGLVSWLGRFDR